MKNWILKFEDYFRNYQTDDGSHDLHHFRRVWKVASKLCKPDTDKLSVAAACYFHDIVSYPKNDMRRPLSSKHAADEAMSILQKMNFPENKLATVSHAIEAHSYSANIRPESHEAKIVQDADRMEALGSLGIARTFYVSGLMESKLFCAEDPWAENRALDDNSYALDHFFTKLLKLPESLQTIEAKDLAKQKIAIMKVFLNSLKEEIS